MPDSKPHSANGMMKFRAHAALHELSGPKKLRITIDTGFWRHVLKSHVQQEPRKAWDSVFGRELMDDMLMAAGEIALEPSIVEQLNKKIEQEMKHGLLLPLILISERAEDSKRSSTGWHIITPAGLCVVVRVRKKRMFCTTAFFNSGNGLAEPDGAARCRKMVRELVRRYAPLRGGRIPLLPADDFVRSHRDTKGGREVQTRQIRFLTPNAWGFEAERPGSAWALPLHFFEQKN